MSACLVKLYISPFLFSSSHIRNDIIIIIINRTFCRLIKRVRLLFLFCYRHQFYLHAKLELCEGRLRPTDNQMVCKTIALLAQAEFGDCDDLVALVQFYAYWCEHLGVSVDDDESIDRIQNLHSEMKVRMWGDDQAVACADCP